MKKVISAILAGAMCAGAFTACGDKKDDKKNSEESAVSTISEVDNQETDELSTHSESESVSTTSAADNQKKDELSMHSESDYVSTTSETDNQEKDELNTHSESEYVSIMPLDGIVTPLDGNEPPFSESIDEGIEYIKNCAEENRDKFKGEYNPYFIKFSGDEFLVCFAEAYNLYYNGKFSVKDGKIKFSYMNYLNPDSDFKVNINDKVEIDQGIISRTSEKLEGLSKEEIEELRKKEQEKLTIQKEVKIMQELNKTGSYFDSWVTPKTGRLGDFTEYPVYPAIRYRNRASLNYDYPNTLYTVDDLLCTDTYGIELDSSYTSGKSFTLKYDFEDTIRNDEQSSLLKYEDEEKAEVSFDNMIKWARYTYGCDDVETTIEFSDGEWEWFNADGGLINNGKYDESKDYPGLIMMYIDEDSKNCPDYAQNTYLLWFYIADDGEIYYPGYVKMD